MALENFPHRMVEFEKLVNKLNNEDLKDMFNYLKETLEDLYILKEDISDLRLVIKEQKRLLDKG